MHIDGSQGEGGGQILRSALALSMVSGRDLAIDNVRANRSKPGLRRQHLTAVHAAAQLSAARTEGAELGSSRLRFRPQRVTAGDYHFRIGTAGSATLVLQTVLPALLIADGPSTVVVDGGTHNPGAPPFDFLAHAYLPLVNRMGPRVEIALEQHGFYPAGGGRLVVKVTPSDHLRNIDLLQRGGELAPRARMLLSRLPRHIAQREQETLARATGWPDECFQIEEVGAHGPGNVVLVQLRCDSLTEVFTSFGRRGVRAEQVADEAFQQVQAYLQTDAPVGPHLADQLLLPLGISTWQAAARGERMASSFRTLPLTRHSTTHIDLLRTLLEIPIHVQDEPQQGTCLVRVG